MPHSPPLSLPRRSLRRLLQRPPLAYPLLPDDRLALRSIRLSHVPHLSLQRSPHTLAAYTRLTRASALDNHPLHTSSFAADKTRARRQDAPSTDREIFPRRPFHHLTARSALIEVSSPARSRATMYMSLGRSALAPLVIAAAAHRSFRTRRSEPIPWHPPPPRGSPHPSSSPARLPLAFALYSSWYVSYTSCAAPPLRAAPPTCPPPPTRSHLHPFHYRLAVSSLTSPPPPPCAF